jgi:hypothetical protein
LNAALSTVSCFVGGRTSVLLNFQITKAPFYHYTQQENHFTKMTTPTTKDTRYDRQLRLWGDSGQRALESAKICLINATATGLCAVMFIFILLSGCEILKNMILPGIGEFTIVDAAIVTGSDVGVNYFLQKCDIGRSRAEAVCAGLCVSVIRF